MSFGDLHMLGVLKAKMNWHQARQKLLAGNIANADTPRYQPLDLKPFDPAAARVTATTAFSTALTHARHISSVSTTTDSVPGVQRSKDWEVTPGGNAVVLEEQMLKVAENQFDFQMATTLYSKSLGLLRSAIGRQS